jgi:FkbM family methyltransferase
MIEKAINRLDRIVHLLTKAHAIGSPSRDLLDPTWRAAVDITQWELIPPILRNNIQVACDIGANKGDWTAGLLRLSQPNLVVAIEPNPSVFPILHRRFSSESRVRLVNVAAGDRKGTVPFHAHIQDELSSIRPLGEVGRELHGKRGNESSLVDVEMKPLDDIMEDVPELCLVKIDVQGFEREVLKGATAVLGRCKCLVVEVLYEQRYYDGAAPFLEVAQLIESISPLRLNAVTAPSLSADGFGAWADAVFVSEKVHSQR